MLPAEGELLTGLSIMLGVWQWSGWGNVVVWKH
jgi:hypothetical protein